MNVYAVVSYGSFCGGMAIVAANSVEDAILVAKGIKINWRVGYGTPDSVELLSCTSYDRSEPKVLTHFEFGE